MTEALVKFSLMDCLKMPQPFRRKFISGGRVAHICKYYNKVYEIEYEIRYMRDGLNVTVRHTDLVTAKNLFVLATARFSQVNEISKI